MGFRPISIRVVEEIDHAHTRPELRRVWHARGDEVFLARMVRPRPAADRQHEVTRDDDAPLRSVRVLGDDRVGRSLDENQGGGRTSKEPERDVAKRMVCFGQAADDVRESGYVPGNRRRFMKMAYPRPRRATGPAQPP